LVVPSNEAFQHLAQKTACLGGHRDTPSMPKRSTTDPNIMASRIVVRFFEKHMARRVEQRRNRVSSVGVF